ncbi:MAG TPA: hypothetical protein VMC10_22180 [Stellaceae bacterium]|nr:hypothetical protein [Stellaceae bacterium]
MATETWDAGPVKVPVMATIREACGQVFGRFGFFINLALLPALAVLVLRLALASLYFPPAAAPDHPASGGPWWLNLLAGILSVLVYNVFLVRWHQQALYGAPRDYDSVVFLQGYRRFVLYSLITYGVVLALAIGLGASSLVVAGFSLFGLSKAAVGGLAIGALIGLVGFSVWMLRCALIFPSAAYGRPLGFGEAWQQIRGNAWRLFGASLLVALIMFVVTFVPSFFIGIADGVAKVMAKHSSPSSTFMMVLLVARLVVDVAATFIGMALGASTLSIFYQRIVLRRAAQSL